MSENSPAFSGHVRPYNIHVSGYLSGLHGLGQGYGEKI